MTHPNSGRIPGVLIEAPVSLAARLHWPPETAKTLLEELCAAGLVEIDPAHWLIWIPQAICDNPTSAVSDMVLWAREWDTLPECQLKNRIGSALLVGLSGSGAVAEAFAQKCLGRAAIRLDQPDSQPKTKPRPRKPPPAAAQWQAEFEELWAAYPKRGGGNPKKVALRAYFARRRDDKVPFAELQSGLARYRCYCEATQKIGTERVLQAATFFGPGQRWAETWELPADLVIPSTPEALATHPLFEQVFAAYPRHDGKEEAWSLWRRLSPQPDEAMAQRMVESIGHWKDTPRWREAGGQNVPPMALWIKTAGWNRSFVAKSSGDFKTITTLLGATAPGNGRVYDGEVVAERMAAPTLPARPSNDPFDLKARVG